MNYFELFGLPVSLQIDKSVLSKKYFELQKQYHPDFYSNASELEQAGVLETSSMINKAYKTFMSFDATLSYVLKIKGLLEEEEKFQLPPEFLMEMMEFNEAIDEASESGEQKKLVDKLMNSLYLNVEPIIRNYDDATISDIELLQLKEYHFKKKYLRRILDRLEGMSNIAP